jgi:hypothetical protein
MRREIMSNKLIADLMSFRARMVADNRTQLMFEGDFDTIDQAIATLRKATITSPQQVSQSEPVAIEALKERDRLGHTVVQVIGTLDEIIEQVEEITLHDVNYVAVPAELWHELEDALEEMPERAESFIAAPHQAIPSGWKLVPIEPTEEMLEQIPLRGTGSSAESIYDAILSASPTAPIESEDAIKLSIANEMAELGRKIVEAKTLTPSTLEQLKGLVHAYQY